MDEFIAEEREKTLWEQEGILLTCIAEGPGPDEAARMRGPVNDT